MANVTLAGMDNRVGMANRTKAGRVTEPGNVAG